MAAAPQRTISGEVPNPDGYIPNLVAKQYGNTAQLAHGVYTKRRFPLSDEEEARGRGAALAPARRRPGPGGREHADRTRALLKTEFGELLRADRAVVARS